MVRMADQKAKTDDAQSVSKGGIREIHAHEAFRRYKLIDLDNTVIERTAAELVEASKVLSNRELWVANFRATIQRVREWCDQSRDQLQLVLVDIRSNKVLFYFVPESDRYSLSLGDQMTSLEVLLGGSSGIGYVETLQVPARSLERFAGDKALLVWQRDPEQAESQANPGAGL